MIFLTVGTQFPFDRLVKAIDDIAGKGIMQDDIFGQIGDSSYKPRNFEAVVSLDKGDFDRKLNVSSGIISHSGMGTITMAFSSNKPLLVLPRLARYGEVVNDHQVGIARKFAEYGHLLAAFDVEELPEKIEQLKTFVPKPRENQAHLVAERIGKFLAEINAKSQ